MKLTSTLSLYVLAGICLYALVFTGCDEGEIEYKIDVDLVYVNQSDSTISFSIQRPVGGETIITLPPSASSKLASYNYESNKVVDLNACCNGILDGRYTALSTPKRKTININNHSCVEHLNDRSVDFSNYKVEMVGNRHYQCTYVFDADDLVGVKPCN